MVPLPRFAALVASSALLAVPLVAQKQVPSTYAIIGARIVPVSSAVIPKGTIVIRDGLIAGVGAAVIAPADARVIDGTGLTVYPGFIDSYGSLGQVTPVAAATPAGGGRGAAAATPAAAGAPNSNYGVGLQPETTVLDLLKVEAGGFDAAHGAGMTAAVTGAGTGIFRGQSALITLGGDDVSGMVVKAPIAQNIGFTRGGGGGRGGYPGSLMGVFAALRQELLDAQHYRDVKAAYGRNARGARRPDYDPSLEALQPVLARQEPVIMQANTEREIIRALDLAQEFNLKPIIAGGSEAYLVAGRLKRENVPVLLSLSFPRAGAAAAGGGFGGRGGGADPTEPEPLRTLRERVMAPKGPGILARAGVRFAFESGADFPNLVANLRKAVAAGLPGDDALKALTSQPAELFGVSDRLGSIETGKIANLTITKGELLDSGHVTQLFVDGLPIAITPPALVANGNGGGRGQRQGSAPPADSISVAPREEVAPRQFVTAEQLRSLPKERMTERGFGPVDVAPVADKRGAVASVLIRNATVMTATNGTLANTDLLLQNGRIAQIGKNLVAPAGATTIDATGKYVTPGIIDPHSHSMADGSVNEGSKSVTSMVRIRDILNPTAIIIYRQLAGGTTTINVLHGSANTIGGQNAVVKLKWGRPVDEMMFPGAPPGIKFALGENVTGKNNGQVVVVGQPQAPRRYPQSRMGQEEIIRDAFTRALDYKAGWDDYRARSAKGAKDLIMPRRDLELEPLVEILEGKRLVHSHSYRADEMLMLLELSDEFHFHVQTFQHGLEGYKIASEIAKHGTGLSTFSDFWGYKIEAYDAIPYNVAIAMRHGVVTTVNSDDDGRARRLNIDAAKLMRFGGLTEEEALRNVTINGAIQLGIDKKVGSIEIGKDADVVIWTGDPLSVYSRAETTFIDGEVFFDRQKDLAMREQMAKERVELEKEDAAMNPRPARGGQPAPAPTPSSKENR